MAFTRLEHFFVAVAITVFWFSAKEVGQPLGVLESPEIGACFSLSWGEGERSSDSFRFLIPGGGGGVDDSAAARHVEGNGGGAG